MSVTNSMPPTRSAGAFLLRLVGYYLLVGGILVLLVRLFPGFEHMLALDFRDAGGAPFSRDALQPPQVLSPTLGPAMNTGLLGTLAMIGGLIFALPVAWTYTATKRGESYDKSVVQMIVMLPLAVGGVVLLVRGELALAFALAGIVAAVRFRTTFKDVKDAVFAFVAIGLGLASGMQAWVLALVISFVFCIVVVSLWRFELGERQAELPLSTGPLTLSEALTPGDTEKAVVVGDPALVAPLADEELAAHKSTVSRLEQHVRADAIREKQKYKHLLLVYAADVEEAEEQVEDVLEEYANRWQLIEVLGGREGVQILEYLVRFKKRAEMSELLRRLQGNEGELIRAVELKSMKGLRDRLTK